MKIYFHLNLGGFSNCYVIANEFKKEAVIIDPGQITEEIIDKIETDSYTLAVVFITHNHGSHVHGLKTLRKIYTPKIYAADWEVAGKDTTVITGDGRVRIAGLTVRYMALPGHTASVFLPVLNPEVRTPRFRRTTAAGQIPARPASPVQYRPWRPYR